MGISQLLKAPKGYERYLRNAALAMVIALVIGMVFGATMVNHLDFYQQQELEEGLNYYLQISDEGGSISKAKIATNSLNTNGMFVFYTTICGLAVVGLPFVWGLVFIRGVVLGFTVGYLVQRLAWRGLVFCLATLFPFAALLIPVTIFSGAHSVAFSWLMITKVFGGGDRTPPPILGYIFVQFTAFVGMFILAMLEAAIVPWLLERLLPWVIA
ncbi:MAG: stage II sporulation protein M [Firmicutes bacterium]|nr:stage II sporulation protein M [Bacillota bacterium]